MVKRQKEDNTETRASKAQKEIAAEASTINANTHYETCTERLTPFGGVLALIKFLDLIKLSKPRPVAVRLEKALPFRGNNIKASS